MNPIKEANTKGLSYGEMARRTGVTRQYINLLALSKDDKILWNMSLEIAYKFKEILGIDIEKYLINSKNNKNEEDKELGFRDDGAAMALWNKLVTEDISQEEKDKIIVDLKKSYGLDTYAMYAIFKNIKGKL